MSRFTIKRKDKGIDDVVLDSEGLTIGRLTGNDLVLNNRDVSRTHAGVKEINEEYWLFNLSESNGTLLNGSLVYKIPLVDGDIIQIGPFTLATNYVQAGLSLTVQMDMRIQPVEGGTTSLLSQDDSGKTMMIQLP